MHNSHSPRARGQTVQETIKFTSQSGSPGRGGRGGRGGSPGRPGFSIKPSTHDAYSVLYARYLSSELSKIRVVFGVTR